MTDTSGPRDEIDGRHARRERNQALVLDAVTAFLADGEGFPTLQQIADRAGLSLRSVHRYFDDGDAAVAAAVVEFQERHRDAMTLPPLPPGATTSDRVDHWIGFAIRVQVLGATALLAATARADQSTTVGSAVETGRAITLDQMRTLFEPDLSDLAEADRPAALAALHCVTLTESWDNLVRRHRLDVDRVRTEWRRMLLALLQPT